MTEAAPAVDGSPARPELSVCIVSYRCRDPLVGCLDAFGAARPVSASGIETIVVDNASNDGTAQVLAERFASTTQRILPSNRGFAAAANQALSLARGRYLLLLNPDVRVDAETLRQAIQFLDREPQWGVLGIRLRHPDGRLQGSCGHSPDTFAVMARSLGIHDVLRRLPRFRDRENLSYFCFPTSTHEVDGVLGAFLMMRPETHALVGPLDEGYFLYGEDLDWCRRARREGVRIVFHPGLEAAHAQGQSAGRQPLRSLVHFHRSSVRYHRVHEAPALPRWARPMARASLTLRFLLASARHLLGLTPAHRTYLVLRERGALGRPRAVSMGRG